MKVPATPPDLDDLLEKATESKRILHVLGHATSGTMTNKYLPWDKLRFKTPPDGLTSDEWWLATRFARRSVQRVLPTLVDVAGQPFSYTLPDQVLEALDEITRKASGNISVSEQVTNPATRDRYMVSSLIEEAITSSQLEGAATSRRVAKEMIRSGRPPKDRSERMILNNYMAMRRIAEVVDQELTPELICEIHKIVTEETLDDANAAGQIQDDESLRIAVWGDGDQLLHKPPPVVELQERMRLLCDFANAVNDAAYMPPVLRAITVHFMMGYDHYFEDGNGRTARALFYWSMLRQGYWLAEFLTISRILKRAPAKYARSFLLTEQDDGDLTHFFIYHLDIVQRAIVDLHEFLAQKALELRELQKTIKGMPGEFNYRQLALLEHAVRSPEALYTAQSHATSHRTSKETARHDLMTLEGRGLLEKIKIGKRYAWFPAQELGAKLRG